MTWKVFFFCFLTPKKSSVGIKKHRNMFYSSRGTRWTLKFWSSSNVHHMQSYWWSQIFITFWQFTWPRTWSFIPISLSAASYTLVFPRSSSSIRGKTALRGHGVPKFATLGEKQHQTAINFPLSLPISGVNISLPNQNKKFWHSPKSLTTKLRKLNPKSAFSILHHS